MRNKIALAVILTLGTCGATAPAMSEGSSYDAVTPIMCKQITEQTYEEFPDGSKKEVTYFEARQASQVQIGEALVTASHVKRACGDLLDVEMDRPEWDIAIIKAGDTGTCRNSEVDEPLMYVGFPGFDIETQTYRDPAFPVKETEKGVVTSLDYGAVQLAGIPVPFTGVMAEGRVDNPRSGYSGGGVFSRTDGRLVGIISSHSMDEQYGYFVNIEDVCQLNDEALAARTQ